MKKLLNRILPAALCAALAVTLLCPLAGANNIRTGKCGKSVKWSLNVDTRTLTLSGKGPMYDYGQKQPPWFTQEEYDRGDAVLKKLVVKKGVTTIGKYAFANADLRSVSLPASLTKIGAGAFDFNTELTSFTVPKRVKTIGDCALRGLRVKSFKVAKGNKYFSVKDGVLYNKKKTVLYVYPARKKSSSYTLPASVRTIKAFAFAGDEGGITGNPYLRKLTLKAKVSRVERFAFADTNIMTYQFKGKAPKFGKFVFEDNLATIKYPKKYKASWKKVRKQFPSKELTFKAV